MAINIPTKSEKHASGLRDAVRLLAWDAYKLENGLKGQKAFEGYESFSQEWKKHEIQMMNLVQIEKFIKTLGYTTEELMKLREDTYQRKALMKIQKSAHSTDSAYSNDDSIPYDY